MKSIPVNTKLSLKGCWEMVNRVDTLEKATVAINWLENNELLSNEDYNDLMMALSWIMRELYKAS